MHCTTALWRNRRSDVQRFLDARHGAGGYRVYNLCSEAEYEHPAGRFGGNVAVFPCDDHQVRCARIVATARGSLVQLACNDHQARSAHRVATASGQIALLADASVHGNHTGQQSRLAGRQHVNIAHLSSASRSRDLCSAHTVSGVAMSATALRPCPAQGIHA